MRQYHIHPSVSLYHGNFHKAINFTISKKGPLKNKKYFLRRHCRLLFVRIIIDQNQVWHFCKAIQELGRSIHLNKSKEKFYGHSGGTALLGVGSWQTEPIFLNSKFVPFYGANTIKLYLTWILFENWKWQSCQAKSEISPWKSLIWKVWAWIVVNWDPGAERQRVTQTWTWSESGTICLNTGKIITTGWLLCHCFFKF